MTTSSLMNDAESRMNKTLDAFKRDINTVRTGRATPSLLDNVLVDYHGVPTPLSHLATITAPEPRLLVIQPWDKSVAHEIEKGILKSNIGLNPANDGVSIRIPMPEPTEERRRDLVKVVKQHAENARVAVRNIRRDVLDKVKSMERNKEISQNEAKRNQDQSQKLTDLYVGQVDVIAEKKQAEVLEV